MRFLRDDRIDKTVLVISDLHLGAGPFVKERANFLEDFHHDKELIEFFGHYSTGEHLHREVELVINGDFLDFLAVPFVEFFDDEFWSEEASLAKLDLIMGAHRGVMDALGGFLGAENKSVTYILGNHDAELVFESARERILSAMPKDARKNLRFVTDNREGYRPLKGVVIKHGHEYEASHDYDPKECVVMGDKGRRFFIPPWGSYYVTRVVNKFKEERPHSNAIRPIKKFIIDGLLHDTMFTFRFIAHNCYYMAMVRLLFFLREGNSLKRTIDFMLKDLELFRDYEEMTRSFLEERDDIQVLIVGHTHEPEFKAHANGKVFINTGTWTDMHHLDFARAGMGRDLTYAQINALGEGGGRGGGMDVGLNAWVGTDRRPFRELS